MYYRCPQCGKKFKYAIDLIPEFGDAFGTCPDCHAGGVLEGEGARTKDDDAYTGLYKGGLLWRKQIRKTHRRRRLPISL